MRKRIGSRAEEFDPAKAEILAEQKKIDDDITALLCPVNRGHQQDPGGGGEHARARRRQAEGRSRSRTPT